MILSSPHPKEHRQHWQALLDSAGEGIWGLDLEGNCTFVNRIAVDTFGFASEELVGNYMHDLVHHHYPDGRAYPGAECPLHEAARKNQPFRQMMDTMFRKDGSFFVAEVSAQPVTVQGGVVGVVITFRELTQLLQQQEELRRAQEIAEQRTAELDAVMESIPDGVYIATPGAQVRTPTRSNHAAKVMGGDQFPETLHTLGRALAGESSTETVQTRGRWIRSAATPILLNGKILGGVAVNSDVTQERVQEGGLRKLEKLAAVGQLASSIAHEINNPLESITNLLYLIRQSDSIGDVQQYAKLAQDELSRVAQITLQTLRFHRQHSKPAEMDLAELLRTIMSLYVGRMLVRNIGVDMRMKASPRVMALEGEIRQVVNNLVRNSLDAMDRGGRLLIRLHPQRNLESGRPGVRLTVADTGEGIGPEIAAHLFEPFQTTKDQTGTGLGLWVSKGIVEKHGGRIASRSRRGPGHGTVFTVWLPVSGSANLSAQAG